MSNLNHTILINHMFTNNIISTIIAILFILEYLFFVLAAITWILSFNSRILNIIIHISRKTFITLGIISGVINLLFILIVLLCSLRHLL